MQNFTSSQSRAIVRLSVIAANAENLDLGKGTRVRAKNASYFTFLILPYRTLSYMGGGGREREIEMETSMLKIAEHSLSMLKDRLKIK